MGTPPQPGSPPDPFAGRGTVTVGTSSPVAAGVLLTGIGRLHFASIISYGATTPFGVLLYDGSGTTDQYLGGMVASAAASASIAPGGPGILFRRGIYVFISGGSGALSLTYSPLQLQPE